MGYSTSRNTLDKMLPELTAIQEGRACVWRVEPGEAGNMAYKIREALYIARLYEDIYPDLARNSRKFQIVVTSTREVQAKPIGARRTTLALVDGGAMQNNVTGPKRLMGPQTADTVVQYWLDTQPSNDKYYFPEANLDDQDLYTLYQWAQTKGLIFFVSSTGGLTLQRTTRDVAEFAWTPEDMDVQAELDI